MGCSQKCIRFLLISLNLGFFLFGLASLALGIFLLVDASFFPSILGHIPVGMASTFDPSAIANATTAASHQMSFLSNGAYMLIGAGGVIFIIAFCGLCGSIKEIKCLLYSYSAAVALFVAIELAIGGMLYLRGEHMQHYIRGTMTVLIATSYTGATLGANNVVQLSTDGTGVSDAIDFTQVTFQCCGASNASDYEMASNWGAEYNYTSGGVTTLLTGAVVPVSCCKMINPSSWPTNMVNITFVDLHDCLTTGSNTSTNTASCMTNIQHMFMGYGFYAMGIAALALTAQFIVIIAACCLIHGKGNNGISRTKIRPINA